MSGRISSPTLIGRADEAARLTDLLAGAEGWRPLVLVRGEAGIGKSRLLDHVLDAIAADGHVVLRGACVPIAGWTLPFGPLLDALRADTSGRSPVARMRTHLSALVERAGSQFDAAGGPIMQTRLFESIVGNLKVLATGRRVVLAIEDLHWSDASTRDLLAFVAHSRSGAWLRLVASLRTDEPGRAVAAVLDELDRAGMLDTLDLTPLDDASVHELIAAIRDGVPADALARSVTARAAGNPFFVEELLASGSDPTNQLSPSLGEMLLTRFTPLPDVTLEAVRYMAVLGERVGEALLAATVGIGEATLARRLRPAVDAGVVIAARRRHAYAFRHSLLREALYGDLLPAERRHLHARAAVAIDEHGDRLLGATERLLALATQLDAAGDGPRALEVLPAAASAAAAAYAHEDAYQLYERAIERWRESPEVARQLGLDLGELHRAASVVATRAGDTAAGETHIRAVLRIRADAGLPEDAGTIQQLSNAMWLSGDEAGSVELAERAYQSVRADGEPDLFARVAGGWAAALAVTSRYAASLSVAEEALSVADRVERPSSLILARATRGVCLAMLGRTTEALADVDEAVRGAMQIDDVDVAQLAFADAAVVIGLVVSDLELLRTLEHAWRDWQSAAGLEYSYTAWLTGTIGLVMVRAGEWDEADRRLTDAMRRQLPTPNRLEVMLALARLRTWQGRLNEAQRLLEATAAPMQGMVGEQFIGTHAGVTADLAAWRGDLAAGLETVLAMHARVVGEPLWSRQAYAAGVRLCADLADSRNVPAPQLAETADALLGALRYEGIALATATAPGTLAWRRQAEAERARMTLDPLTAAAAWADAAEAWTALGRGYLAAYGRVRQAQLLVRAGDRVGAQQAATDARQLADACGAHVLDASLMALGARRSGASPEQRVRPFGLTPREVEVLGLVSEGLSNREIATQLFISEKTAGVHVSNILAKLDVSSRVQAAARAVRAGLVDSWLAPTEAAD